MKTLILLFFTFITALTFQACKGPAGDVGPAGQPGATGAVGATGTQGPAGASSSVQTTAWMSVKSAQWQQGPTQKTHFSVNLSVPAITQAVLDKGLVIGYFRPAPVANAVFALPYTAPGYGVLNFTPFVSGGKGGAEIAVDNETITTAPAGELLFRIVVVPPAAGGRLPAINWKNYEEVKRVLNLTD